MQMFPNVPLWWLTSRVHELHGVGDGWAAHARLLGCRGMRELWPPAVSRYAPAMRREL